MNIKLPYAASTIGILYFSIAAYGAFNTGKFISFIICLLIVTGFIHTLFEKR